MQSEGPGPKQMRGITIVALVLASAQGPLGSAMIAVAVPALAAALGADLATTTGLLATSYLVTSIAAQSPCGKLGDVLGHWRMLWMGLAMCAAGALLGLVAQNLALLAVSRVATALGGALTLPASLAMLRLYTPTERHGRIFGMFGAAITLAAASGPLLGGELLSLLGWRAVFLVHLPFVIVVALVGWRFPAPSGRARQSASEFARSFDWPGMALLTVALALLVGSASRPGPERLIILSAAIAALAAFVWRELRVRNPVFEPRLFIYPDFRASSFIAVALNFSLYGLVFQIPQYLQEVRGATAAESGRALFTLMFSMCITSPLGGRLTDRLGNRRAGLIAAVPQIAGMIWLQNISHFQSASELSWALGLFGAGVGLMNAPMQTAVMSGVPRSMVGMAAGANFTLRYFGATLSMLILSALLGGDMAKSADAHQFTVRIFAIGTLLVIVAAFTLPRRARPSEG